MKINYKYIGVNRVLSLLNLFFLFIFILCLNTFNTSDYFLDTYSAFLIILYFLQIQFFLFYDRINNNPFVLLLCFVTILFTNSRFITFFIDPYSSFNSYSDGELGFVVLYLLLANLFLFLGLHLNKIKKIEFDNLTPNFNLKKKAPHLFIILALFIHIISYYELPIISTLFNYLNVFVFNGECIVLMAIAFFPFIKSRLSKKETLIYYFLILLYIIVFTILGRRGVILNVLIYYLISQLAFNKYARIRLKYIFYLIFIVPVTFITFGVGTILRNQQLQAISKELDFSFFEIIQNAYKEIVKFNFSDNTELFTLIFNRIAYFDYASYYILFSNKFEEVFTFKYYLQSIFDNFLSPGFNFFDSPRVSNALFLVKNNLPVNFENLSDNYNSIQIGIQAEFYNLFGYFPSLILLFIMGYVFNKKYINIASKNNYEIILNKSILLFIFYLFLISYGLDWLLIYSFSIYVTFYIFKFVINKRLKK